MMLFFDNAFIEAKRSPSFVGVVTVFARLRGDIERVFPQTKGRVSTRHGDSDSYRFTATVSQSDFDKALAEQVQKMMCKSPDESVLDSEHEPAYGSVWFVMRSAQARQVEKEARARDDICKISNIS